MARAAMRIGYGLLILTGLGGVCYALGWLKTVYYFRAFGIELSMLSMSAGDYLLASWFVVQNVLFFLLLWWVVLKTRLRWAAGIGFAYALIPIASHYAFAMHDSPGVGWLIHYRHTLLKLIPFVVLLVIWFAHPRLRDPLKNLRWPHARPGLLLFGLITLSWALSTAKHFGSFDANRTMLLTDQHLSRVKIRAAPGDSGPGFAYESEALYLLHATDDTLILWDRSGYRYGISPGIRILFVPRTRLQWVEAEKLFQLQPGSQYL